MSSPEAIDAFLQAISPSHDEIQREMASHAEDQGFPIIGREAGGFLQSMARATDAERVFEFGSGFGYSAYWFLQGMPDTGEVVLTEVDADELTMAEEFFDRAGLTDRAHFEHGDALETVAQFDGPFDVVLIDHQKERYTDAFEAIKKKLPVGGVVLADNVMRSSVVNYFGGNGTKADKDRSRGLVDYLQTVRADGAFHTVVAPVGNGLAISTRERTAN